MTRHHLYRIVREEGGCINRIYADAFQCWSICRANEFTVPDGVYPLRLVNSPDHGPGTILINQEPEVDPVGYPAAFKHHILIHAGNTIYDSKACEVVGNDITTLGLDTTINSRVTLAALKAVVQDGDELEIRTLPIF